MKQQDDAIKTQAGVSKRTAMLLAVVAVLFLLLLIIFLALFASASSGKSAAETDNQALKDVNSQQAQQIKDLNTNVTNLTTANQALTSQVKILTNNVTTLNATVKNLTQTVSTQAAQIATLQSTNTYLWIGGGSALGLGLGATGFGIYELIRANGLDTSLATMTAQYNRFRSYYDQTYLWTVEDYMLYYIYDQVTWKVLYDSTRKWDLPTLVANTSGQGQTATLIMTDQEWMLSGILYNPWKSDQTYTSDSRAFMMSINRVLEAIMPPTLPSRANYAACMNCSSSWLQFGQGEVFLYSNKTGSAVSNRTYWDFDTGVAKDVFYVNQKNFNVKWFQVLQWSIVRFTPSDEQPNYRPSRFPLLH